MKQMTEEEAAKTAEEMKTKKWTPLASVEEGRHPTVSNLKTVHEMGLDVWSALARARSYIMNDVSPWLYRGVAQMAYRMDPRVETYATTRRGVCVINPRHMLRQTIPEIASELCHERLHLFFKHFERFDHLGQPSSTWRIANIAGDMNINEALRKMGGLYLNSTWVFPEAYQQEEDWAFEKRYWDLIDRAVKIPPGGNNGRGNCGSCAGAPEDGDGHGNDQQQALAEADAAAGKSLAEVEASNKQMAEAILADKSAGNIAGSLVREAEEYMKEVAISWRDLFPDQVRGTMEAVEAVRKRMYKFDGLNPLQAVVGWDDNSAVIPTYWAPAPRVCIAIDTSGSMSEEDLGFALSVTRSYLEQSSAKVMVVSCDTETGDPHEVSSFEEIKLTGGGGTDFRPVFELMVGWRPDMLIFVTDGMGPAPSEPPPYQTVWCITAGCDSPVEWGEVIKMEDV